MKNLWSIYRHYLENGDLLVLCSVARITSCSAITQEDV